MRIAPENPRSEVLARLRALPDSEIASRSETALARLLGGQVFSSLKLEGAHVAIYRSLPGEIQLAQLEHELRQRGARLCYPRIVDSQGSLMRFVQVDDPAHPRSWEPGPYGGMEPRAHFPEVAPESLGVIWVPGVAFGRGGERIGRGKGYYDRFLPLAPGALRLAACLDFQLFPSLHQNAWDQPVHCVVSETEEILTERARKWLENG